MKNQLKPINTQTCFEIPEKAGSRICDTCQSEVPIYVRQGKKHSVCMTCENFKLQKEMKEFQLKSEADAFFWSNSIIKDDTKKARFENYAPNHPTQHDALHKAQWYSKQFQSLEESYSLIFKGDYGVGKSHLSHSIAIAVKNQCKKVMFVDVPGLMKKIRGTYGGAGTEESIFQAIKDCDLLILDDIGAEYVKSKDGEESWAVDILIQIVGERANKKNIFTTNYDASGLKHKYGYHGARIVSRMMQGTRNIYVEGDDHRLIKGR